MNGTSSGGAAASVSICAATSLNGMGATVCKPADRLVSTNARGDGSFIVSLPAGSYPMVTAKSKDGLSSNLCDNAGSGATISDVKTTNVSFALDAVPTTCTVSAPQ